MIDRLVQTIPNLATIEPREDIPDYLGEAVHRAGEASYDALDSNNATLFGRLYPAYFDSARAVSDRVREQLANQHPIASMPWLIEPLVDLLSISGQALIFAELHDNRELWRAVRETWGAALLVGEGQPPTTDLCGRRELPHGAVRPRPTRHDPDVGSPNCWCPERLAAGRAR